MYSIGEFIRSKRLELNITMNELADKISTSQSAVSLIENDRRIPSIDTLKKIRDALQLTTEEFNIIIDKRNKTFDMNRKIRNYMFHENPDSNRNIYNYYNTLTKRNSTPDFIMELFDGYQSEINIATVKKRINDTNFKKNDILIYSFIEKAIFELLEKERDFLTNSIKFQFTEHISQMEELFNLIKDKNDIKIMLQKRSNENSFNEID